MTRMTLLAILLFSLCLLMAQEITPWQYVRHSAMDENNQVHVRFNGSPTILNEYELFYWQNNAWLEGALNSSEPFVYEALLPYTAGQNLQYRLRTSYDITGQTVVALNPAFLSSDTFPPAVSALAYIADDPVGDSIQVNYPNLDITGTWFGYSDNKLFAAISNVSNIFPTSNSFTSYNMYFAGLANSATALADSTFYGMLYTSTIPMVFSPGLYKFGLNFADTTVAFTRLGNIQSQVVGGKLILACNISDLTADPSFGVWPPMFNALGFTAGTARIDVDLATMTPTFGLGDYSSLTQLIFEQYNYQVTQNSLPVISDVILSYPGNICALQFTYNDANQDFPLYAKVLLNDELQTVADVTPTVPDFTQPVTMTAILPLPTTWETGEIRISDNNIDFVTYILSTAIEDETLPAAIACNVYPNPFNPDGSNLNIALSGLKNTPVKAAVYNLKGQCVKHLSALPVKTTANIAWDGKTDENKTTANGVYFLQLQQGSQTFSKKIILIR